MALHLKLKRGALHRQLGVSLGQPIPKGKLRRAAHGSNMLLAARARFAQTAAHWRH